MGRGHDRCLGTFWQPAGLPETMGGGVGTSKKSLGAEALTEAHHARTLRYPSRAKLERGRSRAAPAPRTQTAAAPAPAGRARPLQKKF